MKIGILTFHAADNYGAVLQAYGLKESLRQMGHEVYVMDYSPEYLKIPYKVFGNDIFKHGLKNMVKRIVVAPTRLKRKMRFNRFRKERLDILPLSYMVEMDAVITGSDQVWNPNLTGGKFDPYFLLSLPDVRPTARRFSYAASAGSGEAFSNSMTDKTIADLTSLDAISVREISLAQELEKIGIKSSVVLDPVLLGGKKIFDKLTDKNLVPKQPYLFVFSLVYSQKTSEYASIVARQKGLEVVNMCSMDESALHPEIIQSASVERFVSLFKYADFVVTTSFHGTAFSLLFQKPFVSVGFDSKHSERARMLLDSVGLVDAYCDVASLDGYHEKAKFDYCCVDNLLNLNRRNSQNYINQLITPPLSVAMEL